MSQDIRFPNDPAVEEALQRAVTVAPMQKKWVVRSRRRPFLLWLLDREFSGKWTPIPFTMIVVRTLLIPFRSLIRKGTRG